MAVAVAATTAVFIKFLRVIMSSRSFILKSLPYMLCQGSSQSVIKSLYASRGAFAGPGVEASDIKDFGFGSEVFFQSPWAILAQQLAGGAVWIVEVSHDSGPGGA